MEDEIDKVGFKKYIWEEKIIDKVCAKGPYIKRRTPNTKSNYYTIQQDYKHLDIDNYYPEIEETIDPNAILKNKISRIGRQVIEFDRRLKNEDAMKLFNEDITSIKQNKIVKRSFEELMKGRSKIGFITI